MRIACHSRNTRIHFQEPSGTVAEIRLHRVIRVQNDEVAPGRHPSGCHGPTVLALCSPAGSAGSGDRRGSVSTTLAIASELPLSTTTNSQSDLVCSRTESIVRGSVSSVRYAVVRKLNIGRQPITCSRCESVTLSTPSAAAMCGFTDRHGVPVRYVLREGLSTSAASGGPRCTRERAFGEECPMVDSRASAKLYLSGSVGMRSLGRGGGRESEAAGDVGPISVGRVAPHLTATRDHATEPCWTARGRDQEQQDPRRAWARWPA